MNIPASQATLGQPYLTGATGATIAPVKVNHIRPDGVDLEHLLTGAVHTVEPTFLLTPAQQQGDSYTPTNGVSAPDVGAVDITPIIPKPSKRKKKAAVKPMAAGRLTHVRGTVKGGIDLEIPAKHCLVMGDNGSLKTGLVQMIELAIEAGAGDIAGREWVSLEGELLPLVDPRLATEVRSEVECETPDGRKGTYTFVAPLKASNKTGIGKKTHTVPEDIKAVLPARGVLRELRGKPERARKFLLGVACSLTEAEVLADIPPELHVRYAAIAPKDTRTSQLTVAERVVGAQEKAKSAANTAKREAAGWEKEVQTAAQALSARPDEATIAAAQEASQAAQATVVAAAQATPVLVDNSARIAELRAQMAEMQNEATGVQAVIDAGLGTPPEDPNRQGELLQAARVLMEVSLERGGESCLLCSGSLPVDVQHAVLAGVTEAAAHSAKAHSGHAVQVTAYNVAVARLQTLRGMYGQALQELRPLGAPLAAAAPTSGVSLADAQAAQEAAQEALQQLRVTAAGWAHLDGLRASQQAATARQRDLEYLGQVLSDLVANKVVEGSRAWVARVQQHLPTGDTFWFDSTTGRYGLVREVSYPDGTVGDRRDSALCGAEWARVTMAVAAASVSAEVDVAVLIPEDRDWASRSLRNALNGLSAYPGQIVFPTATKPHRGVPKGWGVVVLSKEGKVLLSAVSPDAKTLDAALKLAFA